MPIAFAAGAFPMQNRIHVFSGVKILDSMNGPGPGANHAAAARRRHHERRDKFVFHTRLVGDPNHRRILRNHRLLPLLVARTPTG